MSVKQVSFVIYLYGLEGEKMKKYDVIIFDLDGTLSNSKEGITKCVQYALKSIDIIEEDLEKLEHFIGPPLLAEFMKSYNLNEEVGKECVATYRSRYVPIGVYETEIYPGTEDMLKELKRKGKYIALATSKPQSMAEEVLKYLKIDKYFDKVKGADLHGPVQSKDEVLTALFDMIENKDKEQYLMIGDTSFDIVGANKVGIDSIGVSFGFGDTKEMISHGALTIVESMKDLSQIIL